MKACHGPRHKGRCCNSGIYGHWAEDYKRPKKPRVEMREEGNDTVVGTDHAVAVAGTDQAVLLLESSSSIVKAPSQVVHLVKKKVVPMECDWGTWVLDTGARNHMTGNQSAPSFLDGDVRGTVRFGDGSCVHICSLDSVIMEGRH